jgi:very-short-patch-repair endonuclease
MASSRRKARSATAWDLASRQHGAVSRRQLLALGFSPGAIRHRVKSGRLALVHRGVYIVRTTKIEDRTRWSAAILACGEQALLSHRSAGAVLGLVEPRWPNGSGVRPVEVRVSAGRHPDHPGIRCHQTAQLAMASSPDAGCAGMVRHEGLPVTSPVLTLIDLATTLSRPRLERAVNTADRLALITPERLRSALAGWIGQPGAPALRSLLDADTFALTDSELERQFLAIAASAGLSKPRTGARLNGYKVDFFWPRLGLVVETDGLAYHRTAISQSRDLRRDQAHALAGLTCLRFSHSQVFRESADVRRTLSAVAERLAGR